MLFELLTKRFNDKCKTLYEVIQKESKYGLENQDESSHHGHEVVLIQGLFNPWTFNPLNVGEPRLENCQP
jgi:hypothetical protein